MNLSTLVATVIFLGSVLLSQKIAITAGSRLDNEMKLKVLEIFRKRNFNYTLIVFGMVIAFLAAIYMFPQHGVVITVVYAAAFGIYIFAKMLLNVRKLKEISAPEFYIRNVIMSFAVFIGGAAVAAVVFAFGNGAFAE